MSQPSKGKPTKDPKKGDAKTGTSAKQGVGTGVEASEVKAKAGHSGKVDTSKAASLASKHSTKPGVTVQKTTDPSKGKPTPKMEPGSKTNPAAKQATSSSSFSGAKPKDTALGKAATVSSTKSSGTTGEKQSHSPIAGSQKGKMVLGKTSDTSKDVKQSRNIHAANANSVRFKEEIHQKHLEDVMKIVADMKSQIMSEVSLMIGEEINSLKGTIIKSLESTSIDQKGAVITTLKNASVIEPKNPKESASVSSTASGSANKSAAQGKSDPSAVSLLADTLLPEDTGPTAPKYTGPNVQEDPRSEKKIKKLGEDERTIPPDYRFEEDPNTKVLTDKALIDPLTFDIKSDASISKSAAPPPSYSQAAASKQKEGKTDAHGAFDELSDMLLPEGPVHSGPKYTGPQIKEKTACEKIADKVGEREDSLPPEYRLLPEATSKKDTSVGTHVHPAEKPKPQIQSDIMDVMALDFAQSSPGLITKSPAPSSHCAAPLQKKDQIEPVKASAAFSVSASQPAPKGKTGDMGALDALSDMLQPEAPVHSGPKYTGPEVKEKAAHEKLADKVGEREDSIPPNYRFSSEGADKKGPAVVAPTDSGKKPELLTKIDPVDAMALDFAQSSPAVITKSAVASSHAAPPMQKQDQIEPVRMSAACSVSASKHDAKGKTGDMGALDALSDMLQPEAPVHSGPKYTGPEVKEKKAHEKLADKVGEREDSLPPDYRFNPEDIAKKGPAVPVSTDTAKKPELLTGTDVLDAMASDFAQSSPAIITQSAVASSHAAPPKQTKDQIEPVKASAACSVSASQPAPKGKNGDMGALDALSDMLQPEAPVHSGPKYTGPEVKEKAAREKLADKVGEREDSLPPDYRFILEGTDKKGSVVGAPTDPVKKPEVDLLDAMASDFIQSSPATITQSAAAQSHSAAPMLKKDQSECEFVKATSASSVSASQSAAQGKIGDMGALDELSDMLQPETPVHSGPKYTGPEVKEKTATEKLANKVGERESSLPPDYRFKPEDTDNKGPAVGAAIDLSKKSKMTETQVMDAMSLDFGQNSETLMSKSQAGGTKQKKMDNKAGGLSIETSPTSPTSPKSPKSPTSPTSPTKAKDTASKSAKVNTNIIKMISSDNALPFIYCPMCELVKKIVYTKWNCRLILWSGLVICRDYI
uniref:Calpastatin n=1 Tax=Callorhinchus milii TaxID=7868 RepID=A0A4W3K9X6_CALMI